MKPTYEEIESIFGEGCIKATYEDGRVLLIPKDESNSDYQAYLNPMEHLTEIPTPDEATRYTS